MIKLTPQVLKTIPSASVSTPASGYVTIFADTDNKIKQKDSTGAVTDLTATGGGGGGSGITRSISSVSTNTNAGSTTLTDYVYLASNTCTITLPTAVGNTNLYTIKRTDTTIITIDTTSSQTIDGSTSITLTIDNQSVDIISNGSNWYII